MKKILFQMGDVIQPVGALTTVSNTAVQTPHLQQKINNTITYEETLKKVFSKFTKENKDLLEQMENKLIKKNNASFNYEMFDKAVDSFLNNFVQTDDFKNMNISKEEFLSKKSLIIKNFEENFSQNLKKIAKQKEIRLAAKEYKEFNKFKSLFEKAEKKYNTKFHIYDVNPETSTKLWFEVISGLEKIKRNTEIVISELKDNLLTIEKKIKDINISNVAFSVFSAITGLVAALMPFVAPLVAAANVISSGISLGLSISTPILKKQAQEIKEKIHNLTIFQGWNFLRGIDIIGNFVSVVGLGHSHGFAIYTDLITELIKNPLKFEIAKGFQAGMIRGLGILSAVGSTVSVATSIEEIYGSVQNINQINLILEENRKILNKIIEKIFNLKKVKWIVVNETEKIGDYNNGGWGGRNLHFQNTTTGEVKSLEEMLKYSDYELKLWNLIIVKTKWGYYLRTLPNSYKYDNLG